VAQVAFSGLVLISVFTVGQLNCHRGPSRTGVDERPKEAASSLTPNNATISPSPTTRVDETSAPSPTTSGVSLGNASSGQGGSRALAVCPENTAATKPPKVGKRSPVTPRRVRCGNKTCRANTELCCWNRSTNQSVCENIQKKKSLWVPGGPHLIVCNEQFGGSWLQGFSCDDPTDCGTKVCCQADAVQMASTGCYPRNACLGPEECVRNGHCSKGFECIADRYHSVTLGGFCRPRSSTGVRCGKNLFCKGDRPFCCWDEKTNCGHCSDFTCAQGKLGCASPKDCGPGVHCCRSHFRTYCANDCINAMPLCDTLNDCPKTLGTVGTDKRPTACVPASGLPIGTKICQYGTG